MSSDHIYSTHESPIWRERADFIIKAQMPEVGRREQLWVRQIGELTFEICCIPLFLYDVALGDHVETDSDFLVSRVVEESGRYVFRVWFGDTPAARQPIADGLRARGALLEWGGAHLLAVDAVDERVAQDIADYLQREEDDGRLIFETGRT